MTFLYMLQVQVNGFVSLGSPGYPQYPAWYPTLNQNSGLNSVIAPFWTDIDLRYGNGKIYLGIISRFSAAETVSAQDAEVYESVRRLVLYGYGDSSFLPTQIITVTWQDVAPHDYRDQVRGLMVLCYYCLSSAIHLVTLTFDLAFRWAKDQSKSRLKSKSKVISLSESLSPFARRKS